VLVFVNYRAGVVQRSFKLPACEIERGSGPQPGTATWQLPRGFPEHV